MKRWIEENKNLIYHGVAVITAFGVAVGAVFAWFIFSKSADSGGVQMGVGGNGGDTITIYHILETDAGGNVVKEEKVNSITIANYLPNQRERYRLVIENGVAQERTAALFFENITAEFEPENPELTPDLQLSRVISIQELYTDNLGNPNLNSNMVGGKNNTMYELYGCDDSGERTIRVADSMTLSGKGTGSVYVTFALSPEAHNYYQQKTIKIETISLVADA